MKARSFASVILLFPLLAACSGTGLVVGSDQSSSTKDDAGAGGCTTNADCGANQGCAFPIAAACGAVGTCFDLPEMTCAAYSAACACDGTEVNAACTGFPSGYTSKPVAHTGPCSTETDGGSGGADAGGAACNTDADCGGPSNGYFCGYPEKDVCSATGRCLYVGNVATCAAYSPGCACDGTEINVACSPLPSGYSSKALAHNGACNDAGK